MIRPAALLLAAALALPLPAAADEPALLTLSGTITQVNRGPSDPADATLLGAHDIGFSLGYGMTRAELLALPQETRQATPPGRDLTVIWSGPRLAAVLEAVGASGETILLTAIDGYTLEIRMDDIRLHDPILAIVADGEPLALGDQGPAVVIWPEATDDFQRQQFADWQVWALYHIGIR